jgi:hypothetical protein
VACPLNVGGAEAVNFRVVFDLTSVPN